MTQDDRCANVSRVEDVLHRQRIRTMAHDQLGDAVIDLAQARGQLVAWTCANHAAFEQADQAKAIVANDAVARVGGAWIDAEDDH